MASLDPKTDFVDTDSVFSRVNTLDMCFFAKKIALILVKYSLQSPVKKKKHIGGRQPVLYFTIQATALYYYAPHCTPHYTPRYALHYAPDYTSHYASYYGKGPATELDEFSEKF